MIKNYFKITFRNIKRNPLHSILNISGMAIGIASAILILLWVQDEWSYDRHFKDADNIYRVIESPNPHESENTLFAISSSPLASILKKEYPEIIRSSRYINSEIIFKKGTEISIENNVAVIDKDFLKMFNIEFVKGDINSALDGPYNIILTEEMAHKYFGNEDVLGKTLLSQDHVKTVTGVVKKLHNSHINFDFLVPFEWYKELGAPLDAWWVRFYNYVELQKGTDSKIVDAKIRDVVKKYNKGWNAEISLQNIKKIHLYSSKKYTHDIMGQGDITYVRILGLIATFILIIASINFMNMATAQSARRAKEIGLRKMAGANKRKIAFQFLGESILIVFVAHIIAMILIELLLPGFNNLTGKQLVINYQSTGLYMGLISVVLFCGLMAGSYPAFYLSSLKPLSIIKGGLNPNPGNAKFRRVLVIFQYSISALLIICTLIIGNQIKYMQNKSLGFNKNNIGYFSFPANKDDPKLETLKNELRNNPDIESVTKAEFNPFDIGVTLNNLTWQGKRKGDEVLFYNLAVDVDYDRTFQLKVVEGRFFSPEFATDSSAIVINERAAEVMGFKNPIGEIITIYVGTRRIIGVVKDFHFKPLNYKIEPLIMNIGTNDLAGQRGVNTFFVKMKPGQLKSTIDFIKKTYNSFNPLLPLDFHFLDSDFDNLYRTEQRISKIFTCFSFLAIIISCLGLIGLSSFMTERRTKEIGIRKINGAKVIEIFSMLSKEYIIWVIISITIACPIAWYAMNIWLQNYAYHIDISWWVFALTGGMALLIALLTVSVQSYIAANKRPVEALRYE
jgi:putative ABC transport system permease protein